jgi:hypothetical protein
VQIDDNNIFDWIVGAFMGLISLIAHKQIRLNERNHEDLQAHKLHVSDHYIKKDVVDRIHERIDDMSKDIKTLIGNVGGKK